ncbi:MAG: DUF421 domain-containing protein [Acidimicrobiia bacterium]|nr:DUF421 domain-containing protein [Acidimicrobiia bacterium]
MTDFFAISWSEAGAIAAASVLAVGGVILYVRIAGLRTFAKMSSFDFAITLAIGSILGSSALSTVPLVEGLLAIAVLIALKTAVAVMRRNRQVSRFLDNEPLLLMDGVNVVEANLRKAHVTESDIREKLREANVLRVEDIKAVVFETTGDISVLHGEGELAEELLEGVSR